MPQLFRLHFFLPQFPMRIMNHGKYLRQMFVSHIFNSHQPNETTNSHLFLHTRNADYQKAEETISLHD